MLFYTKNSVKQSSLVECKWGIHWTRKPQQLVCIVPTRSHLIFIIETVFRQISGFEPNHIDYKWSIRWTQQPCWFVCLLFFSVCLEALLTSHDVLTLRVLSGNQITSLPGGIFAELASLSALYAFVRHSWVILTSSRFSGLHDNGITSITTTAFRGLGKLRYLFVSLLCHVCVFNYAVFQLPPEK